MQQMPTALPRLARVSPHPQQYFPRGQRAASGSESSLRARSAPEARSLMESSTLSTVTATGTAKEKDMD